MEPAYRGTKTCTAWLLFTPLLTRNPDSCAHARRQISFVTDSSGDVTISVQAPGDLSAAANEQGWVVRLHLLPGQKLSSASVDGVAVVEGSGLSHLLPVEAGSVEERSYFPFGGIGSSPAAGAGPVAEIQVPATASAVPRTIHAQIAQ